MEISRRVSRALARFKRSLAPAPRSGTAPAGRDAAAIARVEDTTHEQFPPEEFAADQADHRE